MKTKYLFLGMLLAVFTHAAAATNDLTLALQKGLFEEEANHNLDAAISAYQSLVTAFDRDRQVAATAVFRLGECYRKLGRTNEAAAQYERVLRDFSDQPTLATLSSQNLTGLGLRSPALAGAAGRPVENQKVQSEVIQLETALKAIRALPQARRPFALAPLLPAPDATLTELLSQAIASEKQIAAMQDLGPENPERRKLQSQADLLTLRLNEQVTNIIAGLETKLHAAQAELAQTAAPAPDKLFADVASLTDEEEQEIRRIRDLIRNSPDLINAPDAVTGDTSLITAARKGHLTVARFLVDNGADISRSRRGGDTPLLIATGRGHKALVELLLDHGAKVDVRDNNGETPLHSAAQHGFKAVAETLLAHQADVNAINDNGETALFEAAAASQVGLVELLLAKDARVDLQKKTGDTPLLLAAARPYPAIVQLLLDAKADVNLKNNFGISPLLAALLRTNPGSSAANRQRPPGSDDGRAYVAPAMISLLVQRGAAVDAKDNRGVTPLLTALAGQNPGLVKILLEAKANPNLVGRIGLENQVNDNYYSPLGLAIELSEKPELVKMLLDYGADPNADAQGPGGALTPPLALAVGRKDAPADLELLLQHKANPNVKVYDNNSLLHLAVEHNYSTAISLLLKYGADINARNLGGDTPLHTAIIQARGDLVDLLLTNKADVNLQNNSGQTALDIARNGRAYGQVGAGGAITLPRPVMQMGGLFAGSDPGGAAAESGASIENLLREHGAIGDLARFNRIEIGRPGNVFSCIVFEKDTNDWNHYTLLDVIVDFYVSGRSRSNPSPFPTPGVDPRNQMRFPDFTHVSVVRPGRTSGRIEKITVINLLNATNGVDCAKDMPVEFGDRVEIPEREHALSEALEGLTAAQREMSACLSRTVKISFRGQTQDLQLNYNQLAVGAAMILPEVRKMLSSASDLAHVKVKRTDPATGVHHEYIVDSIHQLAIDLRLQNGDIIEVPAK